MNKKFYLIPLIIVIAVFMTAEVVRNSYIDSGDKIYDYIYSAPQTDDAKDDFLKENNFSSYSDILKAADIIVKCKVQPGRVITDKAFFTPIKVLTVYSGNKNLSGQQIQVIENVSISAFSSNKKWVTSFNGYIPLQKNEEYVICLTKKKWNPVKKLSDYENSQYYVTTNSAFGMFRISNNKQTRMLDYTLYNATINNTKGIDVFTNSKNSLNQYYKLKEDLFKKFYIKMGI